MEAMDLSTSVTEPLYNTSSTETHREVNSSRAIHRTTLAVPNVLI
jgi:hypothetical protein